MKKLSANLVPEYLNVDQKGYHVDISTFISEHFQRSGDIAFGATCHYWWCLVSPLWSEDQTIIYTAAVEGFQETADLEIIRKDPD